MSMMTSSELYERFMFIQIEKGMNSEVINQKYGINANTLRSNLLSLRRNKATLIVKEKILALLEQLEKEEACLPKCKFCGKPFKLSNLSKTKQRYCSKECRDRMREKKDFSGEEQRFSEEHKYSSKEDRKRKEEEQRFFEEHKQEMDRLNEVLNNLEGGLY